MYRYVWRVADPKVLADSAALERTHRDLCAGLKMGGGPALVFRDLADRYTRQYAHLLPKHLGAPNAYFQAWVDDQSSLAFDERLKKAPVSGGQVWASGLRLETKLEKLTTWRKVINWLDRVSGGGHSSHSLEPSSRADAPLGMDSVEWIPEASVAPASQPSYCREPRPDLVPRQLLVDRQRYLFDIADKILAYGLLEAWTYEGGFGNDVRVADVEMGYREHESLTGRVTPLRQDEATSHGTAVLSLVCGRPALDNGNPVGMLGLAPAASPLFASTYEAGRFDPSWAIVLAIEKGHLTAGDVVLVEVNTRIKVPGISNDLYRLYPVETFGDGWIASWLAVQRGIHVVHAACNSTVVLDDDHPSGAITVGALSPLGGPPSHAANTGERVKLHAWGDCAASAGSTDERYCDLQLDPAGDGGKCYTFFRGTSAAAALVAGAIASISGILKANNVSASPAVMQRCLLEGGTTLPGGAADDPRRMLYVPGALRELQKKLKTPFKRNKLAGKTAGEIVDEVARVFAHAQRT